MAVFVPNGLELKLETMLVKFCSKMKKKILSYGEERKTLAINFT